MADSSDKPDICGHWVLDRNDDNFDKYLQALGMNWFIRKMISMATVTVDIAKDGDKIEIKTHTPKGDLVECFVPGDGYEMHNVMTGKTEKKKGHWDGDVLITEPVDNVDLPTAKRYSGKAIWKFHSDDKRKRIIYLDRVTMYLSLKNISFDRTLKVKYTPKLAKNV